MYKDDELISVTVVTHQTFTVTLCRGFEASKR